MRAPQRPSESVGPRTHPAGAAAATEPVDVDGSSPDPQKQGMRTATNGPARPWLNTKYEAGASILGTQAHHPQNLRDLVDGRPGICLGRVARASSTAARLRRRPRTRTERKINKGEARSTRRRNPQRTAVDLLSISWSALSVGVSFAFVRYHSSAAG